MYVYVCMHYWLNYSSIGSFVRIFICHLHTYVPVDVPVVKNPRSCNAINNNQNEQIVIIIRTNANFEVIFKVLKGGMPANWWEMLRRRREKVRWGAHPEWRTLLLLPSLPPCASLVWTNPTHHSPPPLHSPAARTRHCRSWNCYFQAHYWTELRFSKKEKTIVHEQCVFDEKSPPDDVDE